MSGDLWIVVPGWRKFQHYKTRHVPWIKLYTELDSHDDWRQLTYGQRGLLVTIWIEYERSKGRLRVSSMPSRSGIRTRSGSLEALVQAGFIQLSSRQPRARERGTTYPIETAPLSPAEEGGGAVEENNLPPSAEAVARVKAQIAKVFEK